MHAGRNGGAVPHYHDEPRLAVHQAVAGQALASLGPRAPAFCEQDDGIG